MKSMLRGVNDRVLRLLDGLVVLRVTIWLVVGVATGVEIWRLSRVRPLRLPAGRRRPRPEASIRRSLRTDNESDAVEGYLAQRAMNHLSFAELRLVSPDPVGDLEGGRYRLAGAELRRPAIEPPGRLDTAKVERGR